MNIDQIRAMVNPRDPSEKYINQFRSSVRLLKESAHHLSDKEIMAIAQELLLLIDERYPLILKD